MRVPSWLRASSTSILRFLPQTLNHQRYTSFEMFLQVFSLSPVLPTNNQRLQKVSKQNTILSGRMACILFRKKHRLFIRQTQRQCFGGSGATPGPTRSGDSLKGELLDWSRDNDDGSWWWYKFNYAFSRLNDVAWGRMTWSNDRTKKSLNYKVNWHSFATKTDDGYGGRSDTPPLKTAHVMYSKTSVTNTTAGTTTIAAGNHNGWSWQKLQQ